MARLTEIDDISLTDLYAELRCREEEKYARRGHRILTVDGIAAVDSPPPQLQALRAGRPVEINDWQLPRWARSRVENRRVTVHPNGRIGQAEW
jgi:hypothetical protein